MRDKPGPERLAEAVTPTWWQIMRFLSQINIAGGS